MGGIDRIRGEGLFLDLILFDTMTDECLHDLRAGSLRLPPVNTFDVSTSRWLCKRSVVNLVLMQWQRDDIRYLHSLPA